MKYIRYVFLAVVFMIAFSWKIGQLKKDGTGKTITLTEARQGFQTKIIQTGRTNIPAPEPPPEIFNTVYYDAPVGKLVSYLTPNPKDGKKHPAIIWIIGGDSNELEDCWENEPASNDQTAAAFRKAGIILMVPSLRGGNTNPGVKERCFGEIDDILSALDYLQKQEYVDTNHIYLGGHSSGGTLVMLVAESSNRFRAVFSFGPSSNVAGRPKKWLTFDTSSKREFELRAPVLWLNSIKNPVFIIEGIGGSIESLRYMEKFSVNPYIHFLPINGADHFSTLAPTTQLIASKILLDNGPTTNLSFTTEELQKPFIK